MHSEAAVFGAVALAHSLAVASPGPDFAMVVRQSLAFGRGAGVWTAAGIGAGIWFHVAYGLFGLAWLTQRYPQSLTALGAAGSSSPWLPCGFERSACAPIQSRNAAPATPSAVSDSG